MTTDALAFVRVSTGSQDESSQIRDLADYAEANDLHIVKPMILHGYQASKGEQEPALRDAIQGIEQGHWHTILVTDSSRLDRREDLDVQAAILLDIRMAGGDIISITEPQFGKTDFAGRIVTLVAQHANAEKSKTVKTSTWRGVRSIIDNKAWYGATPPFWKSAGERYAKVLHCADPDAVKAIYVAISNGHSLSSVAREHGTYPQTIRTLIRTRGNMVGVFECSYTYGGQTYTWQHESPSGPVVDSELWHAANRVTDERGASMNNTGGRPVTLAKSWISGLLACPQCNGGLYALRGKTMRCGGRGKDRRGCGVSGLGLAYITEQVEAIIASESTLVYRYQRVSGNQGQLEELTTELERVRQTLASTDDDSEFEQLSARRKELRDAIAGFRLVQDAYEMTPTGETLADLWQSADKRAIMRAIQKHISFGISLDPRVLGRVWLDGFYPGDTLIELTDDTCIKMILREVA